MWNRFSGKSNSAKDNSPSQSSRRNDDEQRHPPPRSGSITSSISNKKTPSRADDRDPRGFNPTSTSYSSTTQGQYPGAASASIASSYATASGSKDDEPYTAPGLVRNASLADQMPRSSLSRSSRDQGEARNIRDKKREKTAGSGDRDQDAERRQRRDKRDKKDKGLTKFENGLDEDVGTSRGPDDFPDQVSSSSFSQFPGQYDGALPGPNGAPPEHPALSSHVQDQFPGQFPTQSSAPYRPPLAASEGGPGLAAEYYGDDGQSVAEQPGNRANTPSLIIGAEPHLQPALAVAAPPPEPSASGAVGAAASFFSGEFQEDEVASTHGQQNPSTYATGQTVPNSNYHSLSASVIPTLGGAAIGSAAGYFVDSQLPSHQQHPEPESPTGGPSNGYSAITSHHPPSQTHDSHHSSTSLPSKPSKQSSQSSNNPVYAIGAAGVAGLAASAYDHNHHSSNHSFSSTPQYSATSMVQRHRNQGPFGALVDFFEDPEGVAQFEEYSQIIGVCRHCFAPGSSPRDAPRKHFYGRRRSNERYGSNTRVDKDSRYYSSENEGRRKNNKSWLVTGLAGYGLAKVGESLFKEKNDFDDTYNVKTGSFSPNERDRRARRRSHSIERVEIGSTSGGKSDRKEPRDNTSTGTRKTKYSTVVHSGTRSRSTERKTGLTEAAIGAALVTSVGRSNPRRRSRSPKGTSVKVKHKSQKPSPERRPQIKKKKKKRDRGFFGLGNGSFSSSSVDVAYTGTQDKQRSSKRSNGKSKDDEKAEAALLGLGAAAAALALNDGRQGHKRKGVKELVGRKETIDNSGHDSGQAHKSKKSSGNLDDELWESAAEDGYDSVDSDLAYGAPVRRDSRESLSSESSGTNKWGWRWGNKKPRRVSSPRRQSSGHSSFPAVAGAAAAGFTGPIMTSQDQRQSSAMDSMSSLPLQHVYPVPTSDPSRFDVGREDSIASSSRPVVPSRPEAVPLQHPRPIAPVSAAIYSSQTAYDHSYSAPTGPTVFSQSPYHRQPGILDARHKTNEANLPGSFPRSEQQADDTARDFRIRRRDSSPGRFGEDSKSNSIAPRRRTSAKDEASAVRFDLTEEQEERDRRERRRKRKEDKERREVEEQEQIEKERRAFENQSNEKLDSKTKPEEVPDRSSKISWAGPAAAGVIGAAIGAAAATDRSRSEETREERRERRRRERELEDEEDALSKSDRRRRQRERDNQEAAIKERGRLPDEISASREYTNHQERSPEKQNMSVWQEAASTKQTSSHESYGAFFTPPELLNKSSDQVKITSANADADIDLEQVPQIVTVEPKRIHDLSDSPVFSLADSDDKIDPSKLSFPWQVPKLRLLEPTPPSSRASTPIPPPKDVGDEGFEEPEKERSSSQVRGKDDQTHEYTVIAPKENRNDFFEPPSGESSGTDPEDVSRGAHERDLPGLETHPHNDSGMETASAAYDEDSEFAATLAASAEDAGFDPSIVINNPTYRRRDSPPGSNERSMPGGFDDDNEPQLNKKERKRKERASKGIEDNERGDYELNKAEHGPIEAEPAPLISTNSDPIQSNFLDSQQATPTKSSFQEPRTVQDLPSLQAGRDLSSKVIAEETPKQPSSTLENRVLGSVLGSSIAIAPSEAVEHNHLPRQDLSGEENEDLEKGSDHIIQGPVDSPSCNETLDQEDDFIPQKTKKGKKNKRKAGQLQQKLVPTSVPAAVEAKPSMTSINPAPLSSEDMRQIQERDAQDAVDSWSPSVVPSNKSKKGKKGKGRAAVERSPEEQGPSPNAYELPRDSLEHTVPAEGQESDTLTREMSREQIVDIMTSAAQHSNKDEDKALQSATAIVQKPIEVPAKKNRSESKGKKGKKGRKSLSQDHLQRDDYPQSDLQEMTFLKDELPQDNLPRNDLQQRSPPKYESLHDELPQLESQQKTDSYGDGEFPQINFPRDDFSPSQDHQAGSLLGNSQPESLPPSNSSALAKVTFMEPFLRQDDENVHDSPKANSASQEENDRDELTAATSPPFELSPRATPLPDSDDDRKILDERLGTPVFTSLDHSDDKEVEAAAENALDDPHIHDPAVVPRLQKLSRDLLSQAEQVDTDDHFASPSKQRSQKDKTAKQSFVGVKDDETVEIREEDRPIPSVFTSTTLEDDSPRHLMDEPAIEISQGKSEIVQDEREAFTRKNAGKKEKKPKQIFETENRKITEIQEGQESLPNMATSKALEDQKALKLIDESTIDDVSRAKAGALEDKWPGFDSKEDVKVEKQRLGTENLGPGLAEVEHGFERQVDARGDLNDPPASLATARTSQEVSAILGLEETEASIGGDSKEAFPNNSQAERDLQKPRKNQMSNSDERDLPVLYELETSQFEDAPAKARDGEMSTTLDTSVAGTNAAQVVQGILAGKDNAEPATDAKRQAVVASTVMEETATGKSIKEDEGDEYAPKKKRKGKKGKQKEVSSWDEPQTIELAEVSNPLGAMNTPLEQEIAADKPIEEDEMDRDAPKKRKKGKKGKKNEVLSLVEPEIVEPADLSGYPAGTNPHLSEQEPVVEAINEVSSKQSRKDKKNKKGKRKGLARAFSDARDEDESNIVPTEIPQIENKAEDLPATRNDFQEKLESSASLTEVPNDDNRTEDLRPTTGSSRDEVEPTVLPTEILQDDGQMKDFSAVDAREKVEANLFPTEEPQEDEKVGVLPADVMLPMRGEIFAPGEVSEPAVPTELAQDSGREKSRNASEQEQDVIHPRGKKDEKESSESMKSSTVPPDDDETDAFGDDQSAGNKDFEKDGQVQITAASVDAVKEPEKTSLRTQSEQEEDFMLPTSKEDRNKSKELNTLQDGNVPSLLENEPVYKTEGFEREMLRQTFPSSVDVVKEPKTFVEGLSEEKKDREDTKEARPFEWKDENVDAQLEQDTAQDLMKDVESDRTDNPPNASGDLAQMEGKRQEPTHGYFDSVLAHAAASGITHESTSLVRSSPEQPADVSGDITAYHANESEVNIVPAVETDTNPLYSLKPSKKDKKRAKKARSSNREEEKVLQERKAILKESSAAKGLSEPPIIPVSQESEFWSKPEMSAKEVESMEIIQPGMRSTEYQGHQGSVLEGRLSQARDDANTDVEAEREESFANAKRAKTAERTKIEELPVPKRERDRSLVDEKEPAWATATAPTQGNGQTSEQQPQVNLNTTGGMKFDPEESVGKLRGEQAPILTEPGATEESPGDVPMQGAENLENQHDGTQWHEPNIEDLSSSAAPEPVREIVETFRKGESDTNVEPLGTPDKNEPIPAVEVEMLDAQEQRNYNEEYAKELERQLSPLQEGERAGPSRDEAVTPVFSQSSIDSMMERPYEEEHRPLARPPALEDILEESRSRSGSVQGSPVDQEDGSSPSKLNKKGKKSRKGKEQPPVIWEDETATPPMEPENDQGAKPAITSSEGPDSCDIDAARPHSLEEPLHHWSLEDKTATSPTGYSNTASDEPLRENDPPSDYFAIQPSRPAEEDVGREDTHEFRRALSTESPCSTMNRSPGREPQTTQDDHPSDEAVRAYDQDEGLRFFATDSHNKSRTEAHPATEHYEDDFDPTSVGITENGNESKQKPSARKPSSQAPKQEVSKDQTQGLEASATDTSNERSTFRQHSLRSPSDEEDKPLSVAEGSPTSRGRSGSMDTAAALTSLGIGTLAAESLSRRGSVKEGSRGKKAKEGGSSTDFEAGTSELESPVDRGEMAFRELEHRQTPESENAVRARQCYQATPPRSPPANYEAITDHLPVGDLGLSTEAPEHRDSAIYVSGSPMISEGIPYHRAVRDSGYPDTEASPIVDELKNLDNATDLEKSVTAGEEVGHVQHRHSRAHETDERQRSTSRNIFEISVEATSDYDVSISRPGERRKRSRRRSGAAYDSDDSADSGFDVQRRRRRQATAAEPRGPSPVSSTTKDRSSALFNSSPSAREEKVATPQDHNVLLRDDPVNEEPTWSFDREESLQQRSREASREGRLDGTPKRAPESTGYDISTGNEGTGTSLFGEPRSYQGDIQPPSRSPRSSERRSRRRLDNISEDGGDGSPLHKKDKRAVSDVGFPESGVKGRRMRSPGVDDDVAGDYVSTHEPISRQAWDAADEETGAVDEGRRSRTSDQVSSVSSRHSALPGVRRWQGEEEYGTASAASAANAASENSIYALIQTPEQVRSASGLSYRSSGTPTPPLRRVDRSLSGDLRGASQKTEAKRSAKSSSEIDNIIGVPSSSTYDPVTDKGKSRADMADVYEGWGGVRGQSPMSPTRPPSVRKRQSMQLMDLETRLDQIVSENRLLASQKLTAEKAVQEQARDHSQERHAYETAIQEHRNYLTQKDSELGNLRQIIEQLHDQAAHLTEVNGGLASSRSLDEEHEQGYNQLRAEHAHTHEQWQKSSKELEDLKEQHTQLSTGMEDIVRHEVTVALEEKNVELRQLQSELEIAKQQVRNLQQQLLANRNSDDFVERDEDYFDSQCQSLCQHVQQWVLRFSKFSDMKACYPASEIQDEKVVDRMENAILDGSDVDDYLSDRVKRRDVFMSVVMTMIWEFIFTRYLFGMDREQRQKLKILEKTLQEVGPISAVHKWRATTLTLLMKRETFENQRAADTEAVVHEIYDTLATFLPPPVHLVGQIQDSLRKVIDTAVDLSIEMRTQRAEYSMLPPLQPEYDTHGDLARKVYFSALTMNERSGATSSNEALQEQHAVVRMVLFPLVVKNEDDDEQIVVCPAQVLTAEGSKGKKTVRVLSAQGSEVQMEGGMI